MDRDTEVGVDRGCSAPLFGAMALGVASLSWTSVTITPICRDSMGLASGVTGRSRMQWLLRARSGPTRRWVATPPLESSFAAGREGRCLSMLRLGYRIRLSSGKGPDREGVITAVIGSMLRVRWPSQEETTVIPAAGTLTVLDSSGDRAPSAVPPEHPPPKKATAKKAAPKKASPKKAAAKKTAPKKTAPKEPRPRRLRRRRRRRRRLRRRRTPRLGRRRQLRARRRTRQPPASRQAGAAARSRRARGAGIANPRRSAIDVTARIVR
jgi:hypothetical protein